MYHLWMKSRVTNLSRSTTINRLQSHDWCWFQSILDSRIKIKYGSYSNRRSGQIVIRSCFSLFWGCVVTCHHVRHCLLYIKIRLYKRDGHRSYRSVWLIYHSDVWNLILIIYEEQNVAERTASYVVPNQFQRQKWTCIYTTVSKLYKVKLYSLSLFLIK